MGDHVFLKVMPKRGVVRLSKRGKLSLRFIRPFKVLERVGTVSYRLALPLNLSGVHLLFNALFFGSTLQIRLMRWIGVSLLLIQMEPSRSEQYVSWIAGNRFFEARREASEGIVTAPRSGGGNMGTRIHYMYQLSFLI